jgi:hypothetical protein
MTRSNTCSLTVLFFAALLAFAPFALAVDGVVLINQSTSVNGLPGCPHSGFPIAICKSGSYRLAGNLNVSNVNTSGINITADEVTLDLNGFALTGPVTCKKFTSPLQCSGKGTGIGIFTNNDNITVSHGTVRGFGLIGISLGGFGILLEDVHVQYIGDPNRGGIGVEDGTITRCTASFNAGSGMGGVSVNINLSTASYNGGPGIQGSGVATVSNNTVRGNGGNGIDGVGFAVNNMVLDNQGYGISFSSYFGNVMLHNTQGSFIAGTSMGHNLCDGVAC